MKAKISALLLLSILLFSSHLTLAQGKDCNRECLNEILQQYMNAVVDNDPSATPLMVGFRQTENAIVTRPGTGVWSSVTSLGPVQRHYFDSTTGQAAYFGLVNEGDELVITTVRIKVVNQQISESEWYIGREFDTGAQGPEDNNLYDAANLIANPPPAPRNVPLNQRLSRDSLIGITHSYFDGIANHDGSLVMSHPGCLRVENGLQTTDRVLEEGNTDGFNGRSDCTSGMSSQGDLGIAQVASRRYPLIDEEQQIVLGTVVFLRAPNSHLRRNGLSEFFYIDDNLISEIYAAMFYPLPNQPMPNWAPFDGNFPLPANFGDAK